jgi:geranylgeranyl reductase family protein
VKRVAVLGGGPAGAVAAARLAAAGLRVTVLDEKLAWEKPCGGGITYKAYHQYPFLIENDTPKKVVTQTFLSDPKGGTVGFRLKRPLLIYSRLELNRMLLDRAASAGAEIDKERVLGLERVDSGWRIRTKRGVLEADYCVVATGARNALRQVGTEWTASDTMHALGYYVPGERDHVDIQFFPNFEGYIWVFPRCGHLSVGICGKGEPAAALRTRLETYMREKELPLAGATFFGHTLPALESPAWTRNRVAGERWMAAGDAAGLVDPVTGEGLYYAIRSGDLAAGVVLNEQHSPEQKAAAYRHLLQREFIADLTFGAGLAKRFFFQKVMFQTVPARMIDFMRRSPRFTEIVQDLFAGTQNYLELKKRLVDNVNGTMWEVMMATLLGRKVVAEPRA